jgi:hypothetical protein
MRYTRVPLIRRFLRREDGQSAVILTVTMFGVMAVAASGVESGHVYYAYRQLLASTRAAALSGAQAMPNITQASANVTAYSSMAGQHNYTNMLQNDNITSNFFCSSGVSTSLNVACLTPPAGEGACTTGTTCNALTVTQTAQVNSYFGHIIGIPMFNLRAQASASMAGGNNLPYNIAIILDTTGSMGSTASSGDGCSGSTKIVCAVNGIRGMLQEMDPCATNTTCSTTSAYVDDVSLFVFPAVNINDVTDDTVCPQSNPGIVPYSFIDVTPGTGQNLTLPNNWTTFPGYAGTYQIANFSNTYKTNDSTTTLNSSDSLAIAVGGGSGGSCPGVKAPGGENTYYAQVIQLAQSALQTQQLAHAGSKNIMIILSDGDAEAGGGAQAYTSGGANTAVNLVALNCPSIKSAGKCNSQITVGGGTQPLNGTGTSTTNPASGSGTGALGYNSPAYPSALGECGQAVWAAQNATAAGTEVYTVAMDSPTSGSCATDQKYTLTGLSNGAKTWPDGGGDNKSGCNSISAMASDANHFYSDNTKGCAATNTSQFTTMGSIFQAIYNQTTAARIIPSGL